METVSVVLSAIAVAVSIWSAVTAHNAAKHQRDVQERMLRMEAREADRRNRQARSAAVHAHILREGQTGFLVITNDGPSSAHQIHVTLGGKPVLDHPRVPGGQSEVRTLGPGATGR